MSNNETIVWCVAIIAATVIIAMIISLAKAIWLMKMGMKEKALFSAQRERIKELEQKVGKQCQNSGLQSIEDFESKAKTFICQVGNTVIKDYDGSALSALLSAYLTLLDKNKK